MEWIRNLKISSKLMLFLAVSLVFVVFTGIVGFVFTSKANAGIKQLYQTNLKTISTLGTIRGNYEQGIADVLYIYQDISAAQKRHWHEDLNALRGKNGELLKAYSQNPGLSSYEKERIEQILTKSKDFWANMYTSINLVDGGNAKGATKVFNANLHYIVEERVLLNELIKYNEDAAASIDKQNTQNAAIATTILLTTLLASFVLLMLLGLMISNMITKPISQAVEELDNGAEQVAAASTQLSAASEQLASGTSEQAAAIQETSASIEESDSMVKQNNENTQQAAAMAKQAKDFANSSAQEMVKMLASMEELKKSSDEIGKIIKVIDEIAFQTNILALNAAVEAARAGDAGKGFAVVAEEVRNLAQKSAQATKDTAKIIERNITLSNENVGKTQIVGDQIKEIDTQAQKVNELLGEIAVASKEQAQGIEQIDKAIQQMEQVLQSNASTAEESAAASRELSGQAVSVKDVVDRLFVMVEGQEALRNRQTSVRSNRSSLPPSPPAYGRKISSVVPKKQAPENIIPLGDDF